MQNSSSSQLDAFAQIAARRVANRLELKAPEPLIKPRNLLPFDKEGTGKPWVSANKIETQEELEEELKRQRERYAPFLQRLAPRQDFARPRQELTRWNWRMETAEDRGDFGRVLTGAGSWEEITIPHYGGPVGKAVGYYRTQFQAASDPDRTDWVLCFEAADYIATVYCNGRCLGRHEGFYAPFEFSLGAFLRPGEVNTIVVELRNDAICKGVKLDDGSMVDGDKLYAATGLGWDDPVRGWHHCPPGMGIFGQVYLEERAESWVSHVWVRTLDLEGHVEVFLEISGREFVNRPVEVDYAIHGENFSATIVNPTALPLPFPIGQGANLYRFEVTLSEPRLWSPDAPWLYQLQVTLREEGVVVDTASRVFGIRTFEFDANSNPKGHYLLNGKKLRLMGANTMGFEQQDVLRNDMDQLRDDLLLAKICHMNFLRLTQRPVQDAIYDMCDRLGVMTQSDLPHFAVLRRPQFAEAVRQAGEMERMLCPHACNIVVTYINEPFPVEWNVTTSRQLTRDELEKFFKAADQIILSINPDRVIKAVDGDYDPPAPGLPDNHCYTQWYVGHGLDAGALHAGHWMPIKSGWNYACGEFGAEGLDFADLMRRRYPRHWLPDAEAEAKWDPSHIVDAQTGSHYCFFYDREKSVEGWVQASQWHQAFAARWMTEAFRRDKRMISFAIHLFIDAWPAGWMKSIMDSERRAKPAYFAYRDALSPVHVSLRTDRFTYTGGEILAAELWIANDMGAKLNHATVRYQIANKEKVLAEGQCALPAIAHTNVLGAGVVSFHLPVVKSRTMLTVRALVLDDKHQPLHETSMNVEVFPSLPTPRQPLSVIAGMSPQWLPDFLEVESVDLEALQSGMTVFCQAPENLSSVWSVLVEKVRMGAHIVLFNPPAGNYPIEKEGNVSVEPCGMGKRNFVSRATGHPLVEGFQPKDFRLWYDADAGYITPLLHNVILGDSGRAVLATGQLGWGQPFQPADAVREFNLGKGSLIVCCLELKGRHLNPVARDFLLRLASLTPDAGRKSHTSDRIEKSAAIKKEYAESLLAPSTT